MSSRGCGRTHGLVGGPPPPPAEGGCARRARPPTPSAPAWCRPNRPRPRSRGSAEPGTLCSASSCPPGGPPVACALTPWPECFRRPAARGRSLGAPPAIVACGSRSRSPLPCLPVA
eukprot:6212530-Pleurochrysis_carterae.AAC.2